MIRCADPKTCRLFCTRLSKISTARVRSNYARALYKDSGAKLDNLREAVHMLEDSERTARRVFGGAHPMVVWIEEVLQNARAALRARETPETLAHDASRAARATRAQERA